MWYPNLVNIQQEARCFLLSILFGDELQEQVTAIITSFHLILHLRTGLIKENISLDIYRWKLHIYIFLIIFLLPATKSLNKNDANIIRSPKLELYLRRGDWMLRLLMTFVLLRDTSSHPGGVDSQQWMWERATENLSRQNLVLGLNIS